MGFFFYYFALTGGLESETDYKYKGWDEKCKFDKSKVSVNISGAVNISKDEGGMLILNCPYM